MLQHNINSKMVSSCT